VPVAFVGETVAVRWNSVAVVMDVPDALSLTVVFVCPPPFSAAIEGSGSRATKHRVNRATVAGNLRLRREAAPLKRDAVDAAIPGFTE